MRKTIIALQTDRPRVSRVWRALVAVLVASASLSCGSPHKAGETSAPSEPAPSAKSGTADACALLSQSDITETVGNPVLKGAPFAGVEVCKWDTENPDHVSVLLTVRLKGSVREQTLCAELRKGGEGGERVEGLGDIATWKFSKTAGIFNSGDLETCGAKGFVSLSLNGKRDEAALKQASLAIARKVLERL